MTVAEKIPFGIYNIDRDYIEHMAKYDSHVPKCDYEDEGRAKKFYCGPVHNDNGIDFFVPVSHQIRNENRNYMDGNSLVIRNSKNENCGNLDFRFMIPCANDELLAKHVAKSDYAKTQENFCNNNSEDIKKFAKAVYREITSKEDFRLSNNSCDYENLIDAVWEYDDILEAKTQQKSENSVKNNKTANKFDNITKLETKINDDKIFDFKK